MTTKEERKYEVLLCDCRIAFGMTLEDALLFVKAYFENYDEEHRMVLSVKEMDRAEADLWGR